MIFRLGGGLVLFEVEVLFECVVICGGVLCGVVGVVRMICIFLMLGKVSRWVLVLVFSGVRV